MTFGFWRMFRMQCDPGRAFLRFPLLSCARALLAIALPPTLFFQQLPASRYNVLTAFPVGKACKGGLSYCWTRHFGGKDSGRSKQRGMQLGYVLSILTLMPPYSYLE